MQAMVCSIDLPVSYILYRSLPVKIIKLVFVSSTCDPFKWAAKSAQIQSCSTVLFNMIDVQ